MEIGLLVDCPLTFRNKALYVFQNLFAAVGMKITPYRETVQGQPYIYYGSEEKFDALKQKDQPALFIPALAEEINFFTTKIQYPTSQVKGFDWNSSQSIPILFYTPLFSETGKVLEDDNCSIKLEVDLISSSFYFLSCWQELTNPARDAFGRFPFAESIQYKLGVVNRPIVNEYFEIVKELISRLVIRTGNRINFMPSWPEGKTFALALTHDIDHLKKWRWNTFHNEGKNLVKFLLQGDLQEFQRRAALLFSYLLKSQDPYWIYEGLVKEEAQRGFRSSFYFLGGKTHKLYDQGYSLNSKKANALLNTLEKMGAEVGLHSSFETYNRPEMLKEQFLRLIDIGVQVKGNRQHYLRLDIAETFGYLEQAGLEYDTTLGFAESPGYRGSYAYPFFPFDTARDKPHDLLEIPLIIMDGTLRSYQGMGTEGSREVLLEHLEVLRKLGGCGSLLWHNGYFDEIDFPGFGRLYLETLDWLKANQGWGTSGMEINQWWRERMRCIASVKDCYVCS